MEYQEKICRLCITKCTNNFECIEEVTKDMLDTLLVKINLGISDEPVLCTNCLEIIQKCLAFKSICLSTENCIVLFVNEVDQSELDLKEIYQIVKNEQIESPDDHSVCRFCMDLIENEQKGIISERIMLEKCLPELDVTLTKNLVICSECQDYLENYYSFVMNCSKVEEMINKYYESTVINRQGLIQLKDVIQFITKNVCEEDDTGNKPNEEENKVEIKCEQFMEMEDQEFNGTLQYSPKTVFGCEEDDYKVDISKIEDICEKEEIKIKQEEETSMEIESQPFLSCGEGEIKTEQHNLDRLEDNVILPESDVSIKLSKKNRSLPPVGSRIISDQHGIYSVQTKCNGNLQKRKLICGVPSKRMKLIFKCEFCPYQTYFESNFRRHKMIHEGSLKIKMFECESCSYQAICESHLQRHMLIHKNPSKITRFKCEYCSYQTIQERFLQTHLLTHRNSSNIIYKCKFCSYRTKHKYALQKHKFVHKNSSEVIMFSCEFCSYQAKRKDILHSHMSIHKSPSGVKMFKCELCSHQTRRRCDHERHMRIHRSSPETLFKCDFCSYRRKRKRDLQPHMLIHERSSEITTDKCESSTPEIPVVKCEPS